MIPTPSGGLWSRSIGLKSTTSFARPLPRGVRHKTEIYFETQSHDSIRRYRKPVERTGEIKGCAISLLPYAGFLE